MIENAYHRNVPSNDGTELGIRLSRPYDYNYSERPVQVTVHEGWVPNATAYLTVDETKQLIESLQEALYARELLVATESDH